MVGDVDTVGEARSNRRVDLRDLPGEVLTGDETIRKII